MRDSETEKEGLIMAEGYHGEDEKVMMYDDAGTIADPGTSAKDLSLFPEERNHKQKNVSILLVK
jgi:hypothetical protein